MSKRNVKFHIVSSLDYFQNTMLPNNQISADSLYFIEDIQSIFKGTTQYSDAKQAEDLYAILTANFSSTNLSVNGKPVASQEYVDGQISSKSTIIMKTPSQSLSTRLSTLVINKLTKDEYAQLCANNQIYDDQMYMVDSSIGQLDGNLCTVINVADPVNGTDAVNKNYLTSNYVTKSNIAAGITTNTINCVTGKFNYLSVGTFDFSEISVDEAYLDELIVNSNILIDGKKVATEDYVNDKFANLVLNCGTAKD